MQKINTSDWKKYKVTDLFYIKGSTTTPKNELELDNNYIFPYITTAGTNNGVFGYSNRYTEEGNVLTVDSAVLGTTFYQRGNFTASDHVEKLIPKFKITENSALFLVSILNATARIYGYAYNEKRSQKALKNETIFLPSTSDGIPNWEYIENFMSANKTNCNFLFDTLECVNNTFTSNKIDTLMWKKFYLYDKNFFHINTGNKLDKIKMTHIAPTINFVGRANNNNGITTLVDRIEGIAPFEKGYMTVALGGEYLGSCFVQPSEFYTSQNVIVLIPKWEMPHAVKQFISTMIFKESRTYYKAFSDELNRHIKTDFSFLLPVKNDGSPDWEFMNNYMNNINIQINEKVNLL